MTLAQDLPRPRTRIDDIEVLRAFAILFVILWHASILSPGPSWLIGQFLSGGLRLWDGVDLFLVISGFVIGRSLLPLFGQRTPPADVGAHLRAFWTRRAWRLWPASWLWLAIVLLASVCVDLPTSLGTPAQNAWGAVSAIGLFANLRFAADAASWHYFGGLFPYWSLSLEEQFYLLLPLVMLATGRRLPWLLVAGILVQWPLRHGAWLQALRTAALLWGVLLAVLEGTALHRRLEPVWLQRSVWLRAGVSAALLGLLARGAHAPGAAPRFEFGNIALISAALVWLASYDHGYVCPWTWPKPALLWLGSRSYALYLTHIPGGVLAGSACTWIGRVLPITPSQDIWLRIAADAAVLAILADATYRLVEQKFRRHGRWAGHERGEAFFFEKKKQKTFVGAVADLAGSGRVGGEGVGRIMMADDEALARTHGFGVEAVRVLREAIQRGGGRMAQFSHSELGGMGQWSAGGMTQIGAMFDTGLRDRVTALCADLAAQPPAVSDPPPRSQTGGMEWWPDGLGTPSAAGAQNGLRYACFPDQSRVAIEQAGHVTVYDSGSHRIFGVAQSQGQQQSLTFTSQLGTVRAQDLPVA